MALTTGTTEQPIDTSTAAGKAFLDMLGVFAEFETNLSKERQLEGIAKAKAAGVCKGRPASIDPTKVREMKAQGMRPSAIAKALNIGRASVSTGHWSDQCIHAARRKPCFLFSMAANQLRFSRTLKAGHDLIAPHLHR